MKKLLLVVLTIALSNLSFAGVKERQEITEEQAIELAKQEGIKQGYSEELLGGKIYATRWKPPAGYRWHILIFPKSYVEGSPFEGCLSVRITPSGEHIVFEPCVLNRL